jgi:tRNA threonylcarbamoyl adenosine modification protein (Sua5/YciO/YrdC/YwlC family)
MVIVYYPDKDYPSPKDISQICARIALGDVMVFPTDTVYAIGCSLYNKAGIETILKITGKKEKKTRMSVLCKDVKTISSFVLPYSSAVFRTLKEYSPGPTTFILNANTQLSKLLKSTKKEIGVRIPNAPIIKEILASLEHPLISTSLAIEEVNDDRIQYDPEFILDHVKHVVDLMVYTELDDPQVSTVIDCTQESIEIIREGSLIEH